MPLPSPEPPDQDWEVVRPGWWRIDFSTVSWAYTSPDPHDGPSDRVAQSSRAVKPSYHLSGLFNSRPTSVKDQHTRELSDADDDQLNPDLVGVQAALAVLGPYEADVGFHWPPTPLEFEPPSDLAGGAGEVHVALSKERWDDLVRNLTGGLTIGGVDHHHESDNDSLRSLHRSTSTHSSIDLTDSDRSVLSIPMPSTPRARRSYANIVVKTPSSPSRSASSSRSDRSPRRLNAAATAFVPSPAKANTPVPTAVPSLHPSRAPSPPSPTFNPTFVFPTLNVPPVPSVKIAKDAQGFYSQVDSPPPAAQAQARSSSTLLPAFLHDAFSKRRPPPSKTRAMVDKLKSNSTDLQEPSKVLAVKPQIPLAHLTKPRLSVSEHGSDGDTPAAVDDDDGDGWICGDELTAKASTLNSKTRRTRDLFLALRRRSNSSPPKPSLVNPPADDVIDITVELPSPASSSNDGWIEGPALLLPAQKPKPATSVPSLETKATTIVEHTKPANSRASSQRQPKKSKRSGPPPSAMPPPATNPALYAHAPPPHAYFYPPPHAPAAVPVPVPYAAAAYMHQMQVLQMQQQMQHQHQMHMRHVSAPPNSGMVSNNTHSRTHSHAHRPSGGSGDWRAFAGAPPMPGYAVPVPVPVPVPVAAMHPPPMFVPHAHGG